MRVFFLGAALNSLVQRLRWTIVVLVLLGFIIYLYGLVPGFTWAFAFYSLGNSTLLPIRVLNVYPSFYALFFDSLSCSTPWFVSPLSLVFLALAFSAILLSVLSKYELLFLSMAAAVGVLFTQLSLVLNLVSGGAFTLLGFSCVSVQSMVGIRALNMSVISFSNLYPPTISLALFATGSAVFPLLYYYDQKKLLPQLELPGVSGILFTRCNTFRYLNTVGLYLLFFMPVFLSLFFFKTLFKAEFPSLLAPWPLSNLFLMAMLYSICLFVAAAYLDDRFRNELAGAFIPVLAEKLGSIGKPVVGLDELKKELRLTKVRTWVVKDILRRTVRQASTRGLLYFGLCSDVVYLEEPLVKLLREDLNERGFVDLAGRASELGVEPHVLRRICRILTRQGFLGEVKIRRFLAIRMSTNKSRGSQG